MCLQNLVDNPLCDFFEHRIATQLSSMGGSGLNYNGSICESLAGFLDNGPKAQNQSGYDWRNALQNLDEVFGVVNKYGKV